MKTRGLQNDKGRKKGTIKKILHPKPLEAKAQTHPPPKQNKTKPNLENKKGRKRRK